MFGLLAGTLNGAAFGKDVVDFNADSKSLTNTGHAILAINIAAFADVGRFKQSVDEIWEQMKSSPKLPGVDEIRLPGERSAKIFEDRVAESVPIGEELRHTLDDLADRMGLARL
jgi:LDH2 family malate/lactate/ureidoglycolate dehydrogenase